MKKVFIMFAMASVAAFLSVSPCLANVSSLTTTGSVTTTLGYSGPVCYLGYGCGPYNAQVVSDTITGSSSVLSFVYAPPQNAFADGGGYDGDRLIFQVINGTGSTLGTVNFGISGATFGAPGTLPDHGLYDGTTSPNPTYSDGPFFGSLNASNTVWTANLGLAPGAEADFYLAADYATNPGGTPGNFSITQTTPEPGFYGLLALGLSGIAAVVSRRKSAKA